MTVAAPGEVEYRSVPHLSRAFWILLSCTISRFRLIYLDLLSPSVSISIFFLSLSTSSASFLPYHSTFLLYLMSRPLRTPHTKCKKTPVKN